MCANYYAVFTEKLHKLRNKSLILVPVSMGTYFNCKKKAVYSPLSRLIGDNGCADNPIENISDDGPVSKFRGYFKNSF